MASEDKSLKKLSKPKPSTMKSAKKEKENDPFKEEPKVPSDSDLLRAPGKIKKDVKIRKENVDDSPLKSHPKVRKEQAAEQDVKPRPVKVKDEEVVDALSDGKKRKPKDENREKKPRKVYGLPGQKHDVPEDRDPLRIFYESLYQQRPESEMAQYWMMEHGLLSADEAQTVFERKQRKQQGKVGTPIKSPVKPAEKNVVKKSVIESSSKSKKRAADLSDDDDYLFMPKKTVRKGR